MKRPIKTTADYMVMALSPLLIMAVVGSLCFFLIEVFYRGHSVGTLDWVMFWFVIGIVLVARIAIESSKQNAALYGAGLALAVSFYLMRSQSNFIFVAILLAAVWFCADRLVWDCTLIDEEADASGQGLLAAEPISQGKKNAALHTPGRWLIYFSLAALPVFGLGQMLLPAADGSARRQVFYLLLLYLTGTVGLFVTTSFLGLRRYLRQRRIAMPAVIARAWLKFGVMVGGVVLLGAIFLPRPGAGQAWAALHYHIDYQLRRASQYASRHNSPGRGDGRAGTEAGGNEAQAQNEEAKPHETKPSPHGTPTPSASSPAQTRGPGPVGAPRGSLYALFKLIFYAGLALAVVIFIVRRRMMLWTLLRSFWAALVGLWRQLFGLLPRRQAKRSDAKAELAPYESDFAKYRNPFLTASNQHWPPDKIVLYTYAAARAWGGEAGFPPQSNETAREYCARLGAKVEGVGEALAELSWFYGQAGYGRGVAQDADLESLRQLWHRMGQSRVMQAEAAQPKA